MILVDSTKYISWMRRGQNPVAILAPHLQAGELRSCGLIRLEVLRGVVKPAAKAELTGRARFSGQGVGNEVD